MFQIARYWSIIVVLPDDNDFNHDTFLQRIGNGGMNIKGMENKPSFETYVVVLSTCTAICKNWAIKPYTENNKNKIQNNMEFTLFHWSEATYFFMSQEWNSGYMYIIQLAYLGGGGGHKCFTKSSCLYGSYYRRFLFLIMFMNLYISILVFPFMKIIFSHHF